MKPLLGLVAAADEGRIGPVTVPGEVGTEVDDAFAPPVTGGDVLTLPVRWVEPDAVCWAGGRTGAGVGRATCEFAADATAAGGGGVGRVTGAGG